jgi:predicted nucleic acid-binding protein
VATDAFFDTNVLLYLLTPDAKADQAEALITTGGVISVQVLNEFVSVARRKHALAWDEINDLLAGFRSQLQIEPLTVAVHERAVEIAEVHRLNIYDAAILAAAEQAGCNLLHSEDMQHGQRIGGLTIHNPFIGL